MFVHISTPQRIPLLVSPVLRLISEAWSYHFLLRLDGLYTIRTSDQQQLKAGQRSEWER